MVDDIAELLTAVMSKIPSDPLVYRTRVIKNRMRTMLTKLSALDGSIHDVSRLNVATSLAISLKVMDVEVADVIRSTLPAAQVNRLHKWLESIE